MEYIHLTSIDQVHEVGSTFLLVGSGRQIVPQRDDEECKKLGKGADSKV